MGTLFHLQRTTIVLVEKSHLPGGICDTKLLTCGVLYKNENALEISGMDNIDSVASSRWCFNVLARDYHLKQELQWLALLCPSIPCAIWFLQMD